MIMNEQIDAENWPWKIPLTQGKFALVDEEDFERSSQNKWCLTNGYPSRRKEGRVQYLHRFLMNEPTGLQIDHRNGDKLDNRKANLRTATNAQIIGTSPRRREIPVACRAYLGSNKPNDGTRKSGTTVKGFIWGISGHWKPRQPNAPKRPNSFKESFIGHEQGQYFLQPLPHPRS